MINSSPSQVESKERIKKPSRLDRFRSDIFKLSKTKALDVVSYLIDQILYDGQLRAGQGEIGHEIVLSRKGTNEYIGMLEKSGVIKQVYGYQEWDHHKLGKSTYYLGHRCFDVPSLKMLKEFIPALGKVYQIGIELQAKFGPKISRKKWVTALKSILNNIPYISYLTLCYDNEKERVCARQNFEQKNTTPPPPKKPQLSEEQISAEKAKIHEISKASAWLMSLGGKIAQAWCDKVSKNVGNDSYV